MIEHKIRQKFNLDFTKKQHIKKSKKLLQYSAFTVLFLAMIELMAGLITFSQIQSYQTVSQSNIIYADKLYNKIFFDIQSPENYKIVHPEDKSPHVVNYQEAYDNAIKLSNIPIGIGSFLTKKAYIMLINTDNFPEELKIKLKNNYVSDSEYGYLKENYDTNNTLNCSKMNIYCQIFKHQNNHLSNILKRDLIKEDYNYYYPKIYNNLHHTKNLDINMIEDLYEKEDNYANNHDINQNNIDKQEQDKFKQ